MALSHCPRFPSEPDLRHDGPWSMFTEHGQEWLECMSCGAQWSVVDTSKGPDVEQVSDGDESCPTEEL